VYYLQTKYGMGRELQNPDKVEGYIIGSLEKNGQKTLSGITVLNFIPLCLCMEHN